MLKSDSIMTKVEMMDKYFEGKRINSSEIFSAVKSIFGFDLDATPILSKELVAVSSKEELPLSRVVIDSYLEQYEKEVTGTEIRRMINHIFGINLDAISSLEGARISIYSKEQWVVQKDNDLFVVHTGAGDVDVKIYPTTYFTEQTGLAELPGDLQHSLASIGYSYNEKTGCYFFAAPTGEAIPDDFKGQTMGAILKVINKSYSNL